MSLGTQGLQWRFLRLILIWGAVSAVLIIVFAYKFGQERARGDAERHIAELQNAVERTAAIAAYTRDAVLLREVIDGAANNALVDSVSILGPDRQTAMVTTKSAGSSDAPTLRVDRILHGPFDQTETVGVLRIQLNEAYIAHAARSEALMFVAILMLQAILIAMVILYAGARLMSRPIVQLSRDLAMLQPGTSRRLNIPSGHAEDELGVLVGAANDLLSANEAALLRERGLRAEIEAIEAQYRQIFDSTSAGIFVLDRGGKMINCNPTALRVIGCRTNDMRQMKGIDFVERAFAHPDQVRQMIGSAKERNKTVSGDLELRTADGEVHWVHCLISVQDADPDQDDGMVECVMYDVTERKHAEWATRYRAEHDGLTGLKNRAAIEATLDRFIADAADAGEGMALLYVDLDGFKQVNDVLGHKAGDHVLAECAQRMLQTVRRSSDLVGRLGGDEFVIALRHSGIGEAIARETAASLVHALSQPVRCSEDRVVKIGASIGIACYPRDGMSWRQLLHAADEAMYGVKRSGKNGFLCAQQPGSQPGGVVAGNSLAS